MINECDKERLKRKELASILDILGKDVAYIAEIFRKNGDVLLKPLGFAPRS